MMSTGTIIGIIFLFLAVFFIGFLVAKYLTEQKKWGTKKAELLQEFESVKSTLEKKLVELQLVHQTETSELQAQHSQNVTILKEKFSEIIKLHRKDAVMRSRNTLMGKLWEAVAPYIPKFRYHPSDMKFIGAPIDYIIFDGMNKKDIQKIVFLEIKTGKSNLNAQEKKLKNVIQSGEVHWEEFRIDDIVSIELEESKELQEDLKKELTELEKEVERSNVRQTVSNEPIIEIEYTCAHCQQHFVLDKDEREILKTKEKITVKCPTCDKLVMVRK
ncbi:MAG TPA: Holliday junction resolvase-like protein [Candidatus Nanoarchaeia archaeon]|nr:Holliday junction resolvase-like protein [Candidatus Nanoarchaeia archaeon]